MPTPSEQQSKGQMLTAAKGVGLGAICIFLYHLLKLLFVAILNIPTSASLGKQLKS